MIVKFCDPAAVNREIQGELWTAMDRVMARGQYILGPEVEAFEREWADYCGMDGCVGVGNGTDAISLMLRAFGIGRGAEVIVPSNTCIATWMGVSATGAIPIPVEPDSATHNIDPARVAAAITGRTVAVLAVHLYGRAADIAGLQRVCDPRGVYVLVDAAQGHGIKGDNLGAAAAFSFYPTKNLGALGDGGAVVSSDGAITDEVRKLRNYGSAHKNAHDIVGVNSRLDELQAAFLRAKLPHLATWNHRRAMNAVAYATESVGECKGDALYSSVHHQFVMRHGDRDLVRKALAKRGIETAIHYPTPPHLQPAYADRFRRGQFPIAERLARHVISLPIGPEVTEDQARYVARNVAEITAEAFACP